MSKERLTYKTVFPESQETFDTNDVNPSLVDSKEIVCKCKW